MQYRRIGNTKFIDLRELNEHLPHLFFSQVSWSIVFLKCVSYQKIKKLVQNAAFVRARFTIRYSYRIFFSKGCKEAKLL